MERDIGSQRAPVVFPFLIEEPKPSHQDAINQSFSTGVMSKWPDRQSRLVKDAFPPSKNVLSSQRSLKGFQNTSQKHIATKNYSCPNIVDMSNIIFYQDGREHRPRRIINGFFPNKIRSAQSQGSLNAQYRGRSTAQSQTGMCLGKVTKDSTNLTGLRGSYKPNSNFRTSFLYGPNSKTTTTSHHEEHFDDRRSPSCWPVRNGSPSPWLQRYKLKKRATTSYALQKPAECSEQGTEYSRPKQDYVNLSNAIILDAF